MFSHCSNWVQFHTELSFLKWIFRKNGYLENFIIKCFKRFLNNIHLVKKNVLTVEKKCLLLVLPYLGIIPLETIVLPYLVIIPLKIRKKCNQVLKGVLNCCKLKIAFKCQTRVSNSLHHKSPILKDLISGVVYKF